VTPELVALLIAAVAGVPLAVRLDRRASGSLVAGEALLLGMATSAGVLFVLSLLGVPWSRLSFGVAVGAVIAVAWWRAAAPGGPPPAGSTGNRPPWRYGFLAATVVLVVGYALLATAAPVWEFDFIGDWGLKARAFAVARGIDWSFLQHPYHRDIHPDYPPLLPLAFDVFAVVRGSWNDAAMGLISVAFAVALLLVVHRLALEETESPLAAAFITLAMVPFACSPWIGLAEGPLVAYGTTALLLIRRGSVTPGAVMLGLAAATKNEGLTLIAAVAMALALDRRMRDVPRLWPAVVIPLPWLILRRLHGLQTDLTQGDIVARVLTHLHDPRPLLEAFGRYGVGKPLYWIALAAGIAIVVRPLLTRERFVLFAIAIQFAFYIGAYLATPHDVDWHVRWSWERLISHLTPVLTYVVLVRLLAHRELSTEVK
jgi:hypothetical protein